MPAPGREGEAGRLRRRGAARRRRPPAPPGQGLPRRAQVGRDAPARHLARGLPRRQGRARPRGVPAPGRPQDADPARRPRLRAGLQGRPRAGAARARRASARAGHPRPGQGRGVVRRRGGGPRQQGQRPGPARQVADRDARSWPRCAAARSSAPRRSSRGGSTTTGRATGGGPRTTPGSAASSAPRTRTATCPTRPATAATGTSRSAGSTSRPCAATGTSSGPRPSHAYRAGETWWLDAEAEALAAEVQAERRIDDVWERPLLEWAARQLDALHHRRGAGGRPQRAGRAAGPGPRRCAWSAALEGATAGSGSVTARAATARRGATAGLSRRSTGGGVPGTAANRGWDTAAEVAAGGEVGNNGTDPERLGRWEPKTQQSCGWSQRSQRSQPQTHTREDGRA